jgi:hypothetical protein
MSLKTAITFALVGVCLSLFLGIIRWLWAAFAPVASGNRLIFQVLWLADILVATVPMIIFLAVLLSKQKN